MTLPGAIEIQKTAQWDLAKRAEALNADGIFVVSKLKSAKSSTALEGFKAEYLSTRTAIGTLLIDISNHPKSHHLVMRSMAKRLRYVDDYLRREFEARRSRFEKEAKLSAIASSSQPRSSKLNAKLLAKFIIDEAIKLNDLQRDKPSKESDITTQVSQVSEKHQVPAALLNAALNNDEEVIEELDFLGGMDEVL